MAASLVVAWGMWLAPPADAGTVAALRPGRVDRADPGAPGIQTGALLGLNRLDQRDSGRSVAIGTGSDEYDTTMNETGLGAGAAALVLSVHPDWTPAPVSQALTDHATPNPIDQELQDVPDLTLYTGP